MGNNNARWRRLEGRIHPSKAEPRPSGAKTYSAWEGLSGVIPFDKLPRAYQNALAYPPKRQLGTNPDADGRVAHWIPDFEYTLISRLSVTSRAIFNLFILQGKPAREIADTFGWGFLAPHDIYCGANRLKKIIAAHYEQSSKYDWEVAWMLAAEGASDDEIVEIIQCRPETFRKKALKEGRARPKRTFLSAGTVAAIKARIASGENNAEIAASYGIYRSTVRDIRIGRTHKEVRSDD